MKKIAVTLCILVLFVACSKDKPATPGTDTPPVTDTQLKGNWNQVMRIEIEYRNDTLSYQDTDTFDPGDIVYTFDGDSLVISELGVPDEEKYNYAIIGEELLVRRGAEGYFFKLKWHSNDQISLIQDETSISSSGVKRRSVQESVFVRQP